MFPVSSHNHDFLVFLDSEFVSCVHYRGLSASISRPISTEQTNNKAGGRRRKNGLFSHREREREMIQRRCEKRAGMSDVSSI